ncbi:MAG TPA: tyrosine-type recombinase/integrase [Ktedonobacteraceae bacterium]|nr:tyrosine-type recombinase/integrase [Ktedonobacteraceae bacterium]
MARKRRGNGEGSIYQRKDGRYVASISLGHRKRKYIYGETRHEVQEKLKVVLREQQQGTLVTAPQQSVKQFLERWVEQACKPTVRIMTYVQYRSVINHHLVPGLGHVTLQKLTPEMLRAFYREKLDQGLKPPTVGAIHKVLRRALRDAVADGAVARNVASLVKAPRIESREAQTLTVKEAERLLEAARDSSLDALLMLALTTGMRRGELLALRWSDVDLVQGSIFIRRTMTRVAGYGLVENEAKTKSSRRRITLSSVAIEALQRHQAQQEQIKLAVGSSWQDKKIVFCDKDGGLLCPTKMVRWYDKLLKQIGLPHMHFHDLRHSVATILLAAGVHPKKVQELLGHSSITITMDVYSHVLLPMQQDVADKMDDLFKHS